MNYFQIGGAHYLCIIRLIFTSINRVHKIPVRVIIVKTRKVNFYFSAPKNFGDNLIEPDCNQTDKIIIEHLFISKDIMSIIVYLNYNFILNRGSIVKTI